ncbi:hypothetical protein AVEN_140491-1 [Araneus ventricosus]|uniref:Uncharacterized protein n=1 Tax=Araneus ventricosus TaxID=182803 RepID=A0A4Y2NUQ3_ARAVE|nr:hypothetical protein AVEN_140491-1 [Araneus ventricosus]
MRSTVKNKKNVFYPNLSSAIRPVPHTSEISVPHAPSSLDEIRSDSEDGDALTHQDESCSDFSVDEGPQPFYESELNDLVRDLGLSKDGAELLGSRLKNKKSADTWNFILLVQAPREGIHSVFLQ